MNPITQEAVTLLAIPLLNAFFVGITTSVISFFYIISEEEDIPLLVCCTAMMVGISVVAGLDIK